MGETTERREELGNVEEGFDCCKECCVKRHWRRNTWRKRKVCPYGPRRYSPFLMTLNMLAFDRLLLLAFQQTPEVLQHHVPVVEKGGKIQLPSNNPKLSQIVPLLKSLFHSTLILLPNLSSPPTTLLVLSQTEKLIPYITGFRKLIKQLVSSILDIWSRILRTGDEEDEDDKAKVEEQDSVKIAAFLWARKVLLLGDPALKDLVLKVSTFL